MPRKKVPEKEQISYYPAKKVREILMEPGSLGYSSRNELIDQAVLEHVANLKATSKDRALYLLRRVSKDQVDKEIVRVYHHIKASFQETRDEFDKNVGLVFLRAFSRMSEPPIDVNKELEIWGTLIE